MAEEEQAPHHLLTSATIDAMNSAERIHPLNKNAVRHTRILGDAVGLKNLGVHLVRVVPGRETTELHFHHCEEEFMYILSGTGEAEIGADVFKISAGDFLGFTAPSLPHAMRNTGNDDLVYLMVGERRIIDIADYPRQRKRLFRHNGKRELVNWDDLGSF